MVSDYSESEGTLSTGNCESGKWRGLEKCDWLGGWVKSLLVAVGGELACFRTDARPRFTSPCSQP